MPVAITEAPPRLAAPRKRWTRSEFEALSSLGALEGQKLELIEGELINKMGKKPPHGNSLVLLRIWLVSVFGERRVYTEMSIDVAPEDNLTNEPEPDVSVLKRDISHFAKDRARPEDLHLVVEIAHSTLYFDLNTKAALYARAGIAEYWVLDIPGRRMIVHRDPQSGRYASVLAYAADESVAPLAAPDSALRVSDAFLE